MTTEQKLAYRYFVSYSGIKLPLKLVNEISEAGLVNRNTYYRGIFDSEDKMLQCHKIVYGEVESEHQYHYYKNGALQLACITEDDEVREIYFNELGKMV
ncbi:MAG: hypothetical protein HOP23_00375 [Methylococcaceae bacterium]|nr:hypothetical protein [Methylococcaceae bacterium]